MASTTFFYCCTRANVITAWLKEKDVRIVQYMAGYKKVKSTEHYKAARLEDLQRALNQYYPPPGGRHWANKKELK